MQIPIEGIKNHEEASEHDAHSQETNEALLVIKRYQRLLYLDKIDFQRKIVETWTLNKGDNPSKRYNKASSFLIQATKNENKQKVKVKVAQRCPDSLRLYIIHGILQARTGVGGHSLLRGIFPAQGSNQGLPHCRSILNQLSHQGSPRILE